MLIKLDGGSIALFLEGRERFITLHDFAAKIDDGYDFCQRLREGVNQIPFIALPILIKACKQAGYSLQCSPEVIAYHTNLTAERKLLEGMKSGTYPENIPEIGRIMAFLESEMSKYRFTLFDGQKRTIPFCILGKRVLVSNAIGSGKSLCVHLIGRYLVQTGRVKKIVVLVPASLVKNFYEDYCKFFGNSGIIAVREETPKKRYELYKLFASNPNINCLIVNFEKMLFDYEILKTIKIDMLAIDEFHRMRNFFSAQRSINLFEALKENWNAEYRFPLSGTPIENSINELMSIFKLMDGGHILGGQRFFDNNFVKFKDIYFKVNFRGKQILKVQQKPLGFKNLEFLKKLIKPRIIREVLKMPVAVYSETILIKPSKKMLDGYAFAKANVESGAARFQAARQFLCSPDRGGVKENPKLDWISDLLMQTTDKMVIFSFYLCSMKTLAEFLRERNINFYEISGNTTEDPVVIIDKFKNDDKAQVLIATDKVNFGVNINFARWCVEFEPALKPTTSMQRVGRLYRTGQTMDVHSRTLVIADTVEETIYENFESKKEIIKRAFEELNQDVLDKLDAEFEQKVMKEFT